MCTEEFGFHNLVGFGGVAFSVMVLHTQIHNKIECFLWDVEAKKF